MLSKNSMVKKIFESLFWLFTASALSAAPPGEIGSANVLVEYGRISPPNGWNYLEDPSVIVDSALGSILIFGHGNNCCSIDSDETVFGIRMNRNGGKSFLVRPRLYGEWRIHEQGFTSAVIVDDREATPFMKMFIVQTRLTTLNKGDRVRIIYGDSVGLQGFMWHRVLDSPIPPIEPDCRLPGYCWGLGQHHPAAVYQSGVIHLFFTEAIKDSTKIRRVLIDPITNDILFNFYIDTFVNGFGNIFALSDVGYMNGAFYALLTGTDGENFGKNIHIAKLVGSRFSVVMSYSTDSYVRGCAFLRDGRGNILRTDSFVCTVSDYGTFPPTNSEKWHYGLIGSFFQDWSSVVDWSEMFQMLEDAPQRPEYQITSINPNITECAWFHPNVPVIAKIYSDGPTEVRYYKYNRIVYGSMNLRIEPPYGAECQTAIVLAGNGSYVLTYLNGQIIEPIGCYTVFNKDYPFGKLLTFRENFFRRRR